MIKNDNVNHPAVVGRPLAWIRKCSDGTYEGPIADNDRRMDRVRRLSGAWTPLYEPEAMSPEFTDFSRAALLWVLWQHQVESSSIGVALRFALGLGSNDQLSERQIAEAKRWAAMSQSTTNEVDGHNPATRRIGYAEARRGREGKTMDTKAEIAAGEALIPTLPQPMQHASHCIQPWATLLGPNAIVSGLVECSTAAKDASK